MSSTDEIEVFNTGDEEPYLRRVRRGVGYALAEDKAGFILHEIECPHIRLGEPGEYKIGATRHCCDRYAPLKRYAEQSGKPWRKCMTCWG
jgi:hypothetical protein